MSIQIVEENRDDNSWESDYSIDSNCPVPTSKKRVRAELLSTSQKQKIYNQKFRPSWKTHDILKDWIEAVPDNEYLARCKFCDCVLKTKFSSLKTHCKSELHLTAQKNCPKFVISWKVENTDEQPTELEEDVLSQDRKPSKLVFLKNEPDVFEDSECRKAKFWNSTNVKTLIREYSDLKDEFRDPKQKQKSVWEKLAQRLQAQGINVASEDADKKWRNLKLTFKRIFYEEGRTEKSKSQWEYYDSLLVLFSPEENESNAIRKSRTLSPPREDCKIQYEIDETTEMEVINSPPPTPAPVTIKRERMRPKKRKISEQFDDSASYHIEQLHNIDTDSITIEEQKPQIIQSFDIDFLDQKPVYTSEVHERKPMRTEAIVRQTINPLSPTPELVVNPTQAPVWFKHFQKRYDTDTKLMLTKLNNIREVQNTQQNCLNMLEHKLEIIEEKMIAAATRDGERIENSEYDENEENEYGGEEEEEKELSMEEYYIEDE